MVGLAGRCRVSIPAKMSVSTSVFPRTLRASISDWKPVVVAHDDLTGLLNRKGIMEFVLEQFNETRLPTSKVCFEITETSAVGNLDDVVEFMEKMQIIGVRFSLDDFGTGLSSYSYLRNLPIVNLLD